jgi:hypothetical protein
MKIVAASLVTLLLISVGLAEGSEPGWEVEEELLEEVSVDDSAARANIGHLFTYQGRLTQNGQPVGTLHEYRARLYDQASGGSQIGPTLTGNVLPVGNGLFTLLLDFGARFAGADRWLELDVRTFSVVDPPEWTTLTPRQRITPAPAAAELANDEIEFWVMPFNAVESDGLGGLSFVARASGTLEITNDAVIEQRFVYIPVQISGHLAGRQLRLVDAQLCYEVLWNEFDPTLGLQAWISEWNVRRVRANTTSYSAFNLVTQTDPGVGIPSQQRVCETVAALAGASIDGALFVRLRVNIKQGFTLKLRPIRLRLEAN